MHTGTQPKKFNHEETQRHVRHPLQLLRKYIRRYIILEGLALTLLAASILFWIGLTFDFGLMLLDVSGVGVRDFGLFKLDFEKIGIFGVDWVLELNDMDATGAASLGCRIVVFTVVVVGLIALGFTKVVWRWVREFNDRSLALILERRFPKQLGDRLITAVELADPGLSKKYGYSQAMVEKTIEEAVETLKTLPVSGVFNWRRLYGLWALVGVSTLGLFLVSMIVFCVGSIFTEKGFMSPYSFACQFYDVGAVWTERNVMMKNSYWPRNAHLEIEGFQRSKDDANDMRIARDDLAGRPVLQVRAIQWVIAESDVQKAPYGWRALTWQDLKNHNLIDANLLAAVTIPEIYDSWLIDADEIEPSLRKAIFGEEPKATPTTSGEMREYCRQPDVMAKIAERGAKETLDQWLDWRQWTVDKIMLQDENSDVRITLRNLVRPESDHHEQLKAVLDQLKELAESPMLSRTIRKLDIPTKAEARFRSSKQALDVPLSILAGNKFRLPLGSDLKDPYFKLRLRGENYFTPAKTITLVAATAPKSIIVDKEEPAYIYYRLEGMDQSALRGQKHTTKGIAYPANSLISTFEVPLGTNFTIHVETDRKLRAEHSAFAKESPQSDRNFDGFPGTLTVRPDRNGFELKMTAITRNHDFLVEFFDEDNIRGERRFKILRTLDFEPMLGKLGVFGYTPRRARFKPATPPSKDSKDKEIAPSPDHSKFAGAFLITRAAQIPFECAIKDDYGLVHVSYHYKYRIVDFELEGQGGSKKRPMLEIDLPTRRSHANIVASHFQFWPGNPSSWFSGAAHLSYAGDKIETELRKIQKYREGFIACEAFEDLLERRKNEVVNLVQVKEKVAAKDAKIRPWEFDLKESRDSFDVRENCKDLQVTDPELGQMHYLLEIAVQAGDNNVETGRDYTHIYEKKVRINGKDVLRTFRKDLRGNTSMNENSYVSFLIVTENELLAQISLDEIALYDKLEIAKERVDAGMTSLLEQQSKTRGEIVDMDSVLIRMNEIRTALGSAGNAVRDTQQAYNNILKEMEVNRVDRVRRSSIEDNIIRRLDEIVLADPRSPGSLPVAEEAFQEALQLAEADANAKRAPNVEAHRLSMNKAHGEMHRLSKDLKGLLDAMSEGLVESKLTALLESIQQIQLEKSRELYEKWRIEVERILEEAVGKPEKDKKLPEKTPEKQPDPKKIGQLQSPAEPRTEAMADASCPCWRTDDDNSDFSLNRGQAISIAASRRDRSEPTPNRRNNREFNL